MDREYSAYITLTLCESKGIIAVVPPKKNCKNKWEYHRWIYLYRNEIERLFGRIKYCRRVAMRFDKLARRYAVFVSMSLILRFLKVYVNTAYKKPFDVLARASKCQNWLQRLEVICRYFAFEKGAYCPNLRLEERLANETDEWVM